MADFFAERLAAAQAQLVAVDAAIVAVLSGGVSYSLDSGQTRQSVTRASLSELRQMQAALIQQVKQYGEVVSAANGTAAPSGTVYVRPGW